MQVSSGYSGGFLNVSVRTGYYAGSDYKYTGSYSANVSGSFANSIYVGSFIISSSGIWIKNDINNINDDGSF